MEWERGGEGAVSLQRDDEREQEKLAWFVVVVILVLIIAFWDQR